MTVSTLRPMTGAAAPGGWRDQGSATSIEPELADDSDSTWSRGTISYPTAGYECRMSITNLGSPVASNQRIMRTRLRARVGKTGGAGTADEYASFGTQFSGTGQRSDMKGVRVRSTTPTTYTFAWWTKAPHGVEWYQHLVDNRLFLIAHAHGNYGGVANRVKVYELYFDVDIRTQVTVTGVVANEITTTAFPEIAFDYVTNADGDPQRSYQVKVFTQAQTTAAGFNATTTPARWDSGMVRGTAERVRVQTALLNGVSYVAYVRASSDFNGTDWWSPWVASSSFTMAYLTPSTPTLTATPEAVLPSLRTALTVDTKLNLLTADDSSHDVALGSWAALANCTPVVSATQFLDGVQSMRLTATAAADMSVICGAYPVTPGQQYTYLSHYRAGTTGRSVRVKLRWEDGAGNTLSTTTGSNVTDASGSWTSPIFATGLAPDGASQVRIIEEVLAAAAAEIHYSDKGDFHIGSGTVWTVPGGMQKTDTAGATRTDTVLAEYVDLAQPAADTPNLINQNLATGGEAYDSTDGFSPRSTKDRVAVDRTGKQWQGEACIRWVVGEATSSILDLGTAQGTFSSFSDVPTETIPGVPGRQYTLSMYERALAGSHSLALAVQPIDAAGAAVGSAIVGSTVSVGTTMTRLSVTYTVPAGAAAVRGELRNINGDLTTYYLDGGQLEEAAAATTWRPSSIKVTAWRPVRGALSALRSNVGDGIAQIYDREIPPGVIRLYRVWTEVDIGGGNTGRSAFSAYVPVQINPPGVYVLKDPTDPRWDLVPAHLGAIAHRIDEDLTALHPARPLAENPWGQRPAVTSDWISGKNGQLTVSVRTLADWYTLQSLIFAQRALLVQLPSGGQRYLRLTARNWPEPRLMVDVWKVVVDFLEVDRPPVST